MANVISPGFNPEQDGVFKTFPHFNEHLFFGQESDGVNPFKGEISFVGENAGVTKSMRTLEPTEKTDPVSGPKRVGLPFHEEKEISFDRDVAVFGNDLM